MKRKRKGRPALKEKIEIAYSMDSIEVVRTTIGHEPPELHLDIFGVTESLGGVPQESVVDQVDIDPIQAGYIDYLLELRDSIDETLQHSILSLLQEHVSKASKEAELATV